MNAHGHGRRTERRTELAQRHSRQIAVRRAFGASPVKMSVARWRPLHRRYLSPSSSASFSRVAAEEDRTRSFAMSGCGWLWPYYLGVIKVMKTHRYLTQKSVCAGTSGGSLGALVACADIEPEEALEFIIKLSKSKRFFKDIDAGMKEQLLPLLPPDVLDKCNNRLHVVVTRLWPNPSFTEPLIASNFTSKEDLVDHIAASCFIPGIGFTVCLVKLDTFTHIVILHTIRALKMYNCILLSNCDNRMIVSTLKNNLGYSARRLSTRIETSPPDHYFADGGLLAFMPDHIEDSIKVTPFNRSWVKPLMGKVQPDIFLRKSEYSLGNLLKWSLLPASPEILKQLFIAGGSTASYWIEKEAELKQKD